MDALGRFAGQVAHDFNNLLTAVTGYTELLRLDLAEQDPRLDLVNEIANAAQRATALANRLMVFAHRIPAHPAEYDLQPRLRALPDGLRGQLGVGYRLAVESIPAPFPLYADADLIEQALVQVLLNARDAMPEGGDIRLRAAAVDVTDQEVDAQDDAGRRIRHDPNTPLRPGPYARLSVSDSGPGIAPEILDRLFEPFATTQTGRKGAGFGLAIVYGILSRHGGGISVETAPGRGTTVHLYVPRTPPAKDAV